MAKRGTLDHEKNLALAAELGIDPCYSLGILEAFWQWVARHRPSGDVTGANPKHVAIGMLFSGDPEVLWNALLASGWLDTYTDGRVLVHDWSEHADNAVHQSLKRKRQVFADGHAPFSRNRPSDVTASQRCHDSDVTVSFPPVASSQIPVSRERVVPKTRGELSAHLATLSPAEHLAYLRELSAAGNQWATAELQRLEAATVPNVQREIPGSVAAEYDGLEPPPPRRQNAHPSNAAPAKDAHSKGQAVNSRTTLPAAGQAANLEPDELEAERRLQEQAERLWPQVAHQIGEAMGGTPTRSHRETTLDVILHHLRASRQVTKAALLQGAEDVREFWGDRPGYPSLTVLSKGLDKAVLAAQPGAGPAPVLAGREPNPNDRRAITSVWARAIWEGDAAGQHAAAESIRALYAGLQWRGEALEQAVQLARRDAEGGVSLHQERARKLAAAESRLAATGGSLQ